MRSWCKFGFLRHWWYPLLFSAVLGFFFDRSCTNGNSRSADSQSIQCLLGQNVEHLLPASHYDKFLGFELLTVGLPTAFFNVGFCLFLSYLSGPVLLELIFVTYLYQK